MMSYETNQLWFDGKVTADLGNQHLIKKECSTGSQYSGNSNSRLSKIIPWTATTKINRLMLWPAIRCDRMRSENVMILC